MEALSSGDSAGSCDSVISRNSTRSEDSMEHLSAEEKACLMYLEETIEALEAQEDSGLSNDEPDHGAPAHDISTFRSASGRAEDQPSEPQYFTVSAANGHDANSASLDLVSTFTRPLSKSDTGSKTNSSATQTKMLCVSTDIDGKPKIVKSDKISQVQSTEPSGADLGLIPPPSDFMDEPDSPADLHPSLETPIDNPSSEAAEPKGRPVVAPKPKKLPDNIILKSQKVSAPSEGNSGHSGPTSSDRMLLDPQRVRIEALRKLGLLKNEEADLGPSLSPKHSPKTRESWSAPPPDVSPVTPPLTPSSVPVSSPTPASVAPPAPAAVLPSAHSTEPPDILPAPAAFSDSVKPQVCENSPSPVKDVSEAHVNAVVNTPPALTEQFTPPRITGVKSATLERSGLGLSTYVAAQESSRGGGEDPGQPGNSRPRPASLRSRTEGPGSQRFLSAQPSGDSQKLPRSQGISVLICPRAENGADRRNALKKLGLLRD